ncbi:hypothetical protein BDK61_4715 [Haloarcula quadrata]|uniref:Uncharacterized protein n=1 Tax=Haloarcula quadrata TaxID=182779 RepID=A0A495QQD8_9EURY|nr:hypothetical protein BDK61_4715 [Haloarcula quadrata]
MSVRGDAIVTVPRAKRRWGMGAASTTSQRHCGGGEATGAARTTTTSTATERRVRSDGGREGGDDNEERDLKPPQRGTATRGGQREREGKGERWRVGGENRMSWFCIRYTPFARASAVVISGWTGPKRQVVSRSSPAGHWVGESPCGNYKQITETERIAPVCRPAKDRSTRFMNSTRRKYPTGAVYMTPKRTQGGPISGEADTRFSCSPRTPLSAPGTRCDRRATNYPEIRNYW